MGDIDESADMQVVHAVQHLRIGGGIGGRETAVIGGEKQLANFFLERHPASVAFDPLLLFRGQFAQEQRLLAALAPEAMAFADFDA